MSWQDRLPIKKKSEKSTSWMVRPSKEVCVWINEMAIKHPGVSGNQIITAILEDVMKKEKK